MRAILLAAVACSTSHAAAQAFPLFQPTFPAALAPPYILTCTGTGLARLTALRTAMIQ